MLTEQAEHRARLGAVMTATLAAPWSCWDDARRDKAATTLLRWQAAHLPVVASALCAAGVTAESVRGWRDVPMVPVQVHKRVPGFTSLGGGRELRTAGTSGGPIGVVRLSKEGCEVALAATMSVVTGLLPGIAGRRRILGVYDGPALAPSSAVDAAVAAVIDRLGRRGSRFVGRGDRLNVSVVLEALRTSSDGGDPVLLIGGTEELTALLEGVLGAGLRLEQAPDVVLIHTGARRAAQSVGDARLIDVAHAALGVSSQACVNLYHATEIATPFLENTARDGAGASRVKVAPPWVRLSAVDPVSLRPLPPGRVGLLAIMDLACLDRPFHVLTDDLGFVLPERDPAESHFVVLGRSSAADLHAAGRVVDGLVSALAAR